MPKFIKDIITAVHEDEKEFSPKIFAKLILSESLPDLIKTPEGIVWGTRPFLYKTH